MVGGLKGKGTDTNTPGFTTANVKVNKNALLRMVAVKSTIQKKYFLLFGNLPLLSR